MSDEYEYDLPAETLGDDEYGDLFIDLSEKEADSKPLSPMPTGKYHLKCTDGELRHSKSEKNPGKPYYALEFTIQSGEYSGRKVWTNAMLWAGAAYTIVQIAKAMNPAADVTPGQFRVPKIAEIMGTDFIARVAKTAAKLDADGGELYAAKNEIKSFEEYTGKNPSKGEQSLLP